MSEDLNASEDKYIEFSLGELEYAVPLLMVREVIPVPETTQIPRAPKHFVGIMNLRGHVITVIDLRMKLNIEPRDDREEAVIILAVGDCLIGVVVDAINRVISFSLEQASEVPEIQTQVNAKYIKGVFRKEKSLTIYIDVAKILDIDEMKFIKSETEQVA